MIYRILFCAAPLVCAIVFQTDLIPSVSWSVGFSLLAAVDFKIHRYYKSEIGFWA